MLAMHYVLIFFGMHFIAFHMANLKQVKNTRYVNTIAILAMIIYDVINLRYRGYHLVLHSHAIICLLISVTVLSYAMWDFKKILIAIYIYSFFSLSGMVATGFLFPIFSIEPMIVIENVWFSLVGTSLSISLVFIFHLITKALGLKVNINALDWKGAGVIVFLTVIFGFYIASFVDMEATGWGQMVTAFAMLGGMVALYSQIVYIARETHIQFTEDKVRLTENTVRRHEESLRQQKAYYDLLKDKEEQKENFIHDAKKLLLPLITMVNDEEITGELAQLIKNLKTTTDNIQSVIKVETGSKLVDANLQYLMHQYKDEEINFQMEGYLPSNHMMTVTDVISLFSNLLENAFEAVVKTEGDKAIMMKIKPDVTTLYIKIENNYVGDLKEKAIGFETTKKDKENHGIGLQSIQSVVDKYNGIIEISSNHHVFCVEITFPRTIYK